MPRYLRWIDILKLRRNSVAALSALLGLTILYAGVAIKAQEAAGGQDSWNHYLYARWCFKHPHLMLDLWAKPFLPFLRLHLRNYL